MRRAAVALSLAVAVAAGVAAAASQRAVPASVERAIVARFPQSTRFYFPTSLPPGYVYDRWEVVGRQRSSPARDAFRLMFAPPGKTFAQELKRNGNWATWVGYRRTKPCSQIYFGGWSDAFINGRHVYFLQTGSQGNGFQVASICGPGSAADLTLNHWRFTRAKLLQLVAQAHVVTR
jgi:hypothetical protein